LRAASCLGGALRPIDFRAVCLVLAMFVFNHPLSAHVSILFRSFFPLIYQSSFRSCINLSAEKRRDTTKCSQINLKMSQEDLIENMLESIQNEDLPRFYRFVKKMKQTNQVCFTHQMATEAIDESVYEVLETIGSSVDPSFWLDLSIVDSLNFIGDDGMIELLEEYCTPFPREIDGKSFDSYMAYVKRSSEEKEEE
jgi:hypothetical protein